MPELARKIESLPWIEDGIEGVQELGAVRGLILLADAGYTAGLIEEPWVVKGTNYQALEALRIVKHNHPETLDKIMSHPTISDGITVQEAKILATLTTAANPVGYLLEDADLLDKLLDPEQVLLEERTITLPLAGETDITIVRTRPGADRTMDFMEQSVRNIEEFMGLPFPRRQAIYLFVDAPGGGINLSTHVQIRASEQATSGESMFNLVAHETSHYYWTGLPTWLSEGAATFMESVVADTLHRPPDAVPCRLASTIAEFETLKSDPTSFAYFDCEYSLGTNLLYELYQNMDDTTFRLAFRRLFLHTEFDVSDGECEDFGTTICHVREAFSAYVPEETKSVIEDVITRRYGRTDLPDANIRGVVTGQDGRSPGRVALTFSRGGQGPRVEVAADGTFEIEVESGTYIVVVRIAVGSELVFVGWYDGKGSITTDPSQAYQVTVEGADVEGIDIRLPTDTEGLLCPTGSFRSLRSGNCTPQ